MLLRALKIGGTQYARGGVQDMPGCWERLHGSGVPVVAQWVAVFASVGDLILGAPRFEQEPNVNELGGRVPLDQGSRAALLHQKPDR